MIKESCRIFLLIIQQILIKNTLGIFTDNAQSIDQSINQLMNQPINQSITNIYSDFKTQEIIDLQLL